MNHNLIALLYLLDQAMWLLAAALILAGIVIIWQEHLSIRFRKYRAAVRAWFWFYRKFGLRRTWWWWNAGRTRGWMTAEQFREYVLSKGWPEP